MYNAREIVSRLVELGSHVRHRGALLYEIDKLVYSPQSARVCSTRRIYGYRYFFLSQRNTALALTFLII